IFDRTRELARMIHFIVAARRKRLTRIAETELSRMIGLNLTGASPTFEVHAVRPARRVGPDGQSLTDLIIVITQRETRPLGPEPDAPEYTFRGGCTLIVDSETGEVRYCVVKNIDNQGRRERQQRFLLQGVQSSGLVRSLGLGERSAAHEPFALIHRSHDEGQDWS
ncbi:MAG: hypothetical protein ACRC33_02395, partial [Gemmataceae bacterium]